MEREAIKQKVTETLVKTLGIKPQELKPEVTLYENLGVDSTEMVEVVIALSRAFNTQLSAKEINKFSTIDEIVNTIKSKL